MTVLAVMMVANIYLGVVVAIEMVLVTMVVATALTVAVVVVVGNSGVRKR